MKQITRTKIFETNLHEYLSTWYQFRHNSDDEYQIETQIDTNLGKVFIIVTYFTYA